METTADPSMVAVLVHGGDSYRGDDRAGVVAAMTTAVVLVVLLISVLVRNWHLRRQLKAASAIRELGDDELLTELEVRAITSPLAKKLLVAASKSGEPTISPATVSTIHHPEYPEQWKHNIGVNVPAVEHWKLFVIDMQLEADDLGRAVCLDRWLEDGTRFTYYERVKTVAMFQRATPAKS